MKIIAHRKNDLRQSKLGWDYAEIDVQLSDEGIWVVKHDVDERYPVYLNSFLEAFQNKKFFVDIKQNISASLFDDLLDIVGKQLLGIFDVPFPSAYYCSSSANLYARLSDFEPPNRIFSNYWMDPLASFQPDRYAYLLGLLEHSNRVIVCSPELHGVKDWTMIKPVWAYLKKASKAAHPEMYGGFIEGLVTKHVEEAKDFFA